MEKLSEPSEVGLGFLLAHHGIHSQTLKDIQGAIANVLNLKTC